ICTVGGTTSGYCAMGRLWSDTSPMITMTIERTVAKIGRSTKKRANISLLLRLRRRLRGGRCPWTHADLLRRHGHPGAHALDAVHDHPLAGRQPFGDGPQPALDRAELHLTILDDVLVVHDQHVLAVLVGADGAVAHQEAGCRLA